jgi:predicted N-acyltransferase
MNHTRPDFANFEDFCENLKSRKRYPIRRSQKKFDGSNLRIVQRLGGDGVDELYTDDVHRLYEAVFERAEVRLEKLEPEVFRELARRLPDNSAFTFVYQDDRIVAFAASVFTDRVFHQMFVGVDYDLNPEVDLYFNLFFHAIDFAFRQNVADIFVGQSADTFKQRKLGCYQVPLSFYIRGVDRATAFVIRRGFKLFFPPRPAAKG